MNTRKTLQVLGLVASFGALPLLMGVSGCTTGSRYKQSTDESIGNLSLASNVKKVLAAMRSDVVTITWDASNSGSIGNYCLYYGTNALALSYSMNTGLTRTQVLNLPYQGPWFFAVTAVDTNGVESTFSNLIKWEAKPVPPPVNGGFVDKKDQNSSANELAKTVEDVKAAENNIIVKE